MITPERQMLHAADGYPLAVHQFNPEGEIKAAVIIAPAMGVPQSFYHSFATWLAGEGFATTTFDYRGIGHSAPARLRGFTSTIHDWAEKDCAAVLDSRLRQFPGLPLFWLGHSLGGQLFGMVPQSERVSKLITVGAGSGYWRSVAKHQRLPALILWYSVVPALHPLFGYFPGKKLRIVGDLPRGVMNQWRRWCLSPHYLFSAEGEQLQQRYGELKLPITGFSFADDEMMTLGGIEQLHSFYRKARTTIRHVEPRSLGVDRIGHFGIFRSMFRETLWPELFLGELFCETGNVAVMGVLPSHGIHSIHGDKT